MTDDVFASSDSVRGANALGHAQTFRLGQPLKLELGGELPEVTVAYETYGRLSKARDNAVLICHALSGDSHVARHDPQDVPGWWDIAVGPGKAIDTDQYFVICPNILGGCRGTTGPNSIDPAIGRCYGADFPTVTIGDMVEVQRLLIDHLGIDKLLAVVGGSMGGHQVLQWAIAHPDRLVGAVPIATSARLSSQSLAFDVVARNAILRDPDFRSGQYYEAGPGPDTGLAIARMIGHITYLSAEAMQQKFETDRLAPRDVPVEFEKKFSVGSYLGHQGSKFVERFDANSYVTLSMAMDLFDLGATPQDLAQAVSRSRCRWLLLSFTSDWLFSPAQSRRLVAALVAAGRPVSYCNVRSNCGHDAFLLPDDLDRYGELIRGFLANLNGRAKRTSPEARGKENQSPTSIFHSEHPQRLDHDRIVELIGDSTSVLDLGCGGGGLLLQLKDNGVPRTVGVELSEEMILACVAGGLDVVHADLNEGLAAFQDQQFDCVVLSRTLQAVRDVERLVDGLLRVGRRCIVSFPNFAYRPLRTMLYKDGLSPEASGILRYKWFNSPNIRFFSIADFETFCVDKGITVHRRMCLDTERRAEIDDNPNLEADLAIFVISR